MDAFMAFDNWCRQYEIQHPDCELSTLELAELYSNAMTWRREPKLDKRFAHGDDFAGDAWANQMTGEIRYTAVGHTLTALRR